MKSTITHISKTPAYATARDQANRLQDELAKLELEIDALSTSRNKPQTGNAWLDAGVAALSGDLPDSPKLSELTRRRDAIATAILPAHHEVHNAVRTVSREYYKTQAPATLTALDSLADSLESVLIACDAFKTIRDQGESLGYDAYASSLPLAIDEKFSLWVKEALPELRRDADKLRDSLDKTLDDSTITVLALADISIFGTNLKSGETGEINARYGRELIRSGTAEESSPGRSRMSKLKSLLGA